MEFGSAGRDGPGFTSSSPSSSSSSPQYKPGNTAVAGQGPLVFDGPDTKLELMPKNEDGFGLMARSPAAASVEKEHMFDKVVTPSDVGKLNRLVIPKQHAEKYFPLDSAANEKGLLLNFEDRNGKPWRFRYSYWNSSQSYVMTKGWSRFVKEKKLDAGDVVSFHRGLGELAKDRLFIDWRRRPDAPDHYHIHGHHHHHHPPPGTMFHTQASMFHPRSVPWSPALMRPPPSMNYGTMNHLHHNVPYRNSYGAGSGGQSYAYGAHISQAGGPVFYVRSPAGTGQSELEQLRGGSGGDTMVFDSVPVGHGKAGAAATVGGKRLRLFGVNMECPNSEGHEECVSSNSAINAASQGHHPLQLRLYNGTPIAGISTVDYLNKGKASMTLNFDI